MARMGGGHRGGGGGGSFGGGGFGGGGFGGHRGGGGLGGGPRPSGFGGPPHHHHHHHHHGHFWGPGWGWHRRGGWYYGPGGCAVNMSAIIFLVVILFFMVLSSVFEACSYVVIGGSPDSQPEYADIQASTVVRQPMPSQYLIEIDEYYYDGAGCLVSAAGQYSVEQSLKHFYAKTGVQPYLYIDDDLNGNQNPDFDDVEQFMNDKYYELFEDEGHILVLYFEYSNGEYNTWYMRGNDAYDFVMDDEACEIMLDFIDYHYQNPDTYDYADLFSRSFNEAAERIMGGKTRQGISIVTVIFFLIFASIAISIIVSAVKNNKKSNKSGGSDDNMSEEDKRKERYRQKYGNN